MIPPMNYKASLHTSLKTAWIIIKLIIPIYILADVLFYYNLLAYVAFIFEPITTLLELPVQSALAIISGMFLNLYAAIAFAAPLDLTPKEWTILAIYLGICHALIVESAIIKKLGFSLFYSYSLRIISGLVVAYLCTFLPDSFFGTHVIQTQIATPQYTSIIDLLINSFWEACILSMQIILLISAIIFAMDYVKSLPFIKNSQKNVSKSFSLGVGTFLGITYGAGILIQEANSKSMSRSDMFYVVTFLMICHAIIEDTLLFAIFGANITLIIVVRTIAAIIIAWLLLKYYDRKYTAT